MTYRERVAIEHPKAIQAWADGGVYGCPTKYYGMQARYQECVINDPAVCTKCWNRVAPPRKVKPRRKEHEKANG